MRIKIWIYIIYEQYKNVKMTFYCKACDQHCLRKSVSFLPSSACCPTFFPPHFNSLSKPPTSQTCLSWYLRKWVWNHNEKQLMKCIETIFYTIIVIMIIRATISTAFESVWNDCSITWLICSFRWIACWEDVKIQGNMRLCVRWRMSSWWIGMVCVQKTKNECWYLLPQTGPLTLMRLLLGGFPGGTLSHVYLALFFKLAQQQHHWLSSTNGWQING